MALIHVWRLLVWITATTLALTMVVTTVLLTMWGFTLIRFQNSAATLMKALTASLLHVLLVLQHSGPKICLVPLMA